MRHAVSALRRRAGLLGLRLPAFRAGLRPYLAARRNLHRYRLLSVDDLRATRRSDTIFIFGSGASLNDIPADEFRAMEEHDTLGFNWFVHERFVRCDYHMIRGIPDTDFDKAVWVPQLDHYFKLIRENPHYRDTIFLVQTGFRATNGNRAIGLGMLPYDREVFLWRTRDSRSPSFSFGQGLSHGHSTLHEAVNFAFLLGWSRIVLVGVDLYDRRYFWLPPEEARTVDMQRGASADDAHSVGLSPTITDLGRWRELFLEQGVELEVYNPRSLLARVLPVYSRS